MNRKVWGYSKLSIGFVVLFLFPFLAGCGEIEGSGVDKSEERKLSEFSSIEANGAFSFEIACGESPFFEITGDDNLVPLIKTDIQNSQLKISTEKPISPKNGIRIKIKTGGLKKISFLGAHKAKITGVKEEKFVAEMTGATKLEILGEAQAGIFSLNGAGDLAAKDFKTVSTWIEVNGAGRAELFATEELNATVNGAGKIDYYGEPKNVKPLINGIGKITKK